MSLAPKKKMIMTIRVDTKSFFRIIAAALKLRSCGMEVNK